jgi:hypothetical protein
MRKVLIPLAVYALLTMVYLSLSGAPLRVHVLSLSVLALAFLVPSIWAAHVLHRAAWLAICCMFAIAAMVFWDASAHLVIVKAEPFFILRSNGWLYLIGSVILVSLSFGVAWAACPPNPAVKRDALNARPLP